MKKFLSCIVTACIMSLAVLSLTACSNSNSSSDTSSTNDYSALESAVSSSSSGSSASESSSDSSLSGNKYATVEEYVKSDAVQSQLDTLKTTIKNMGMDVEVSAEDNKLIYTYTYDTDVDTEGMADQLKETLETQSSTFKSVLSSLKSYVDVDSPVIVIKYLNNDGTEIYTHEFTDEA